MNLLKEEMRMDGVSEDAEKDIEMICAAERQRKS